MNKATMIGKFTGCPKYKSEKPIGLGTNSFKVFGKGKLCVKYNAQIFNRV